MALTTMGSFMQSELMVRMGLNITGNFLQTITILIIMRRIVRFLSNCSRKRRTVEMQKPA
ncbi:hypothetical protein TH4_11140 [Thalassospira tepidiphila MCCC 1A03514]|uniref:Uncharacterized protein n=1 Tax=Thalassospira tepidiphila MCCC 1A03514 TaxID=1177930 RepID=A0A853KYI7_9PROT|nr:hypothetical protein TH4_11140 [Thalassospira tepidiphila MCCC 1A03514]